MSVPFTAVQFSAYESLKGLLNPSGTYSPGTHIVAGGVAGGLAAAVTTPLDVAKVSFGLYVCGDIMTVRWGIRMTHSVAVCDVDGRTGIVENEESGEEFCLGASQA
jgi:hypothetical protein